MAGRHQIAASEIEQTPARMSKLGLQHKTLCLAMAGSSAKSRREEMQNPFKKVQPLSASGHSRRLFSVTSWTKARL